jgi:hypothetical protein
LLIAAGSFIGPSVLVMVFAAESASRRWVHPFVAALTLLVIEGIVMIATAWLVVGLAGRGHRLWITSLAVCAGIAAAVLAVVTALSVGGSGLWS